MTFKTMQVPSDMQNAYNEALNQEAHDKLAALLKIAEPPEPLPELPEVMRFEYDFLPGAIRDYVIDISERMQCPPDFAAVNTYVMLSAPIGCKIGIRPKRRDNWVIVPNLWGVTIGGSGIMKSPNRNEALKPLKQLQVDISLDIAKQNEEIIKELNAMFAGEEIKKIGAAHRSQESIKEGYRR